MTVDLPVVCLTTTPYPMARKIVDQLITDF